MLLETLFWVALLLGAAGAPTGWPFLRSTAGFAELRRRHGLDPAAGQRVRRDVFSGRAPDDGRERAAAADWADQILMQQAATRREHPGRWRAFLALQAAQGVAALAGLAVSVATKGSHGAVLDVLFVLLLVGPLVRPVVRRRRDDRVRRVATADRAATGEPAP